MAQRLNNEDSMEQISRLLGHRGSRETEERGTYHFRLWEDPAVALRYG